MNELVLFVISVLPVFLIGMYIYKKDKEKEPTKLLVKLFLGGFLSCILVLIISLILNVFPIFSANEKDLNLIELFIHVFIGIALVEEFCKWLIAYKISYNDNAFDENYDAILYCVFVALGFACFENLLYVYSNGISTGLLRAIFAVPGHACDGLFMGYYLGMSKIAITNNKKDLKNKYLFLSILVPTLLHGIYDYCLFSENIIFIVLFFIFIIVVYIKSIKKVRKVSSTNMKFKYKNNYCTNCGYVVNSNYCPRCGRKNE